MLEAKVGGGGEGRVEVEHKAVPFRNLPVEALELLRVIGAEIARRIHAGEHDRDVAGLEARDDLLDGPAGHGGVEAAQHVVGAELDDHPVGPVRNRPVEPLEAARRGVARHARIGDLDLVTPGLQRALKNRREGGALGQAVAGRQAVAEHHDAQGAPGRLGRGCHRQQRRTRKNERPEKAVLALHP